MDVLDEIFSSAGINLSNEIAANHLSSSSGTSEPEEQPSEESITVLTDEDFTNILNEVSPFEEIELQSDNGTLEVSTNSRVDSIIADTPTDIEAAAVISTQDTPQEETVEEESREVGEVEINNDDNLLVEPNSPTILMDQTNARFSGTEWYNKMSDLSIVLAGVGGIGSWTALMLSRLNIKELFLYDPDEVEAVNMSGQFFRESDIGRFKSTSLAVFIQEGYATNINLFSFNSRYDQYSCLEPIMICGFDNMSSREIYFNRWREMVNRTDSEYRKEKLFIDGRLSIDTFQIFCIRGDDEYNIKRYKEEWLFSDEEADATVCSMKQTTFMAAMIGSYIANLVVNFAAGLTDTTLPYDLPFLTEYNSQNMLFNTCN